VTSVKVHFRRCEVAGLLAFDLIDPMLRIERLSQALWGGLDPTSQYREFARAVETVPSIANLRALAGECVRVATENRIRAGADAAMGYPRLGMLDVLKLLSGLLVGLFRSHAAREADA
jgi:hypothetical protein